MSLNRLESWFLSFGSAIIAFSSGVDSSVLAKIAYGVLGERAIALTSLSPSFSRSEVSYVRKIAEEIGIELIIVRQDDLATEGYVANQVNRCYFCRSNLASAILPIIRERKIDVCVDGTHIDDMSSPRPGVKALREAGFRAPFVELGIGKKEIRSLARLLNLSNSEKPSEACLSSRIAYGQRIDERTLRMVEDAESYIRDLIKPEIVRVRTIGRKALIEVDHGSIERTLIHAEQIESQLRTLGYEAVEIDPQGYVQGKMLELFVKMNE